VKKWIQARLTAINHRMHSLRYATNLNTAICFGVFGFLSFIANISVWHFALLLIVFLAVDIIAFGNGVKAERDWTIKHPQ
jgi:hypothetical protein